MNTSQMIENVQNIQKEDEMIEKIKDQDQGSRIKIKDKMHEGQEH